MRWLADMVTSAAVLVVALVVLPGGQDVRAEAPPAVNPPGCRCLGKCECGHCACDLLVGKAAVPTDADRYQFVYDKVVAGGVATVAVGVPLPTPLPYGWHEAFPSGFMGLADGVYNCHLAAGNPVMSRQVAAGQAASGCPGGVCPPPRVRVTPTRGFFRW